MSLSAVMRLAMAVGVVVVRDRRQVEDAIASVQDR